MGPAPREEHGTCPTEYTKPEGKIILCPLGEFAEEVKVVSIHLQQTLMCAPSKAGSQRKPCTMPWPGRGVINRNIVYNMCQHEHVVHTPTGAMNIQPTNCVVQLTNMCI